MEEPPGVAPQRRRSSRTPTYWHALIICILSTQWVAVDGSDFKDIHVTVRGYNDIILCGFGPWTDACKPDIELKVPSIGTLWRCDYHNNEMCSWLNAPVKLNCFSFSIWDWNSILPNNFLANGSCCAHTQQCQIFAKSTKVDSVAVTVEDPHACANTEDVAWRAAEDCCDLEGAGPCDAGQGQCQTDDECRGTLYCGEMNCAEEWITRRRGKGDSSDFDFDFGVVSSWGCCSAMKTIITAELDLSNTSRNQSGVFEFVLHDPEQRRSAWNYPKQLSVSTSSSSAEWVVWNFGEELQQFDAFSIKAVQIGGSPHVCVKQLTVTTEVAGFVRHSIAWSHPNGGCKLLDNFRAYAWQDVDCARGDPCNGGLCKNVFDEFGGVECSNCPVGFGGIYCDKAMTPSPTSTPTRGPSSAPTATPTALPTPAVTVLPTATLGGDPVEIHSSKPNVGVIVGSVVAVLVATAGGVLLLFCLRKNHKLVSNDDAENAREPPPSKKGAKAKLDIAVAGMIRAEEAKSPHESEEKERNVECEEKFDVAKIGAVGAEESEPPAHPKKVEDLDIGVQGAAHAKYQAPHPLPEQYVHTTQTLSPLKLLPSSHVVPTHSATPPRDVSETRRHTPTMLASGPISVRPTPTQGPSGLIRVHHTPTQAFQGPTPAHSTPQSHSFFRVHHTSNHKRPVPIHVHATPRKSREFPAAPQLEQAHSSLIQVTPKKFFERNNSLKELSPPDYNSCSESSVRRTERDAVRLRGTFSPRVQNLNTSDTSNDNRSDSRFRGEQKAEDDDALDILRKNTTLFPAHLMLSTENHGGVVASLMPHARASRVADQPPSEARRDVVVASKSSSLQHSSTSEEMAECIKEAIKAYDDEALDDFDVDDYA